MSAWDRPRPTLSLATAPPSSFRPEGGPDLPKPATAPEPVTLADAIAAIILATARRI